MSDNRRFENFGDNSDDIEGERSQRRRKFDIRAAKRAKQGGFDSRKKDKGFQRTSKEDRGNRW